MTTIRKVIRLGNCRAITIPRGFPEVEYVITEMRGEEMIVKPLREAG